MEIAKREIEPTEIDWKFEFQIDCLGVKIGFRSNNSAFINKLKKKMPDIVPIAWKEIFQGEVEHWYSVFKEKKNWKEFRLYKESEFILANNSKDEVINYLETQIRSKIAEYARDFVFLHAGVVSWKGKGIIIPGKSFSGKTTLVSELIKRNCEYLSDEFAVLDRRGLVHPFPKKLSVRGIIDEYRQVDFDVEQLGGTESNAPVPVGYLLLTEYQPKKKNSRIKIVTSGEGVMAGVANSISVRHNPKLVLEVLSVVANQAVILKTKRGEAAEFAEFLLEFLEKHEKSKITRKSVSKSATR